MILRLFFLLVFLFFGTAFSELPEKRLYKLSGDPIDVVIVAHPKDKTTLDACIDGIRANCRSVRRVVVVSAERLTRNAEWFDEKKYPFDKDDVFLKIGRGSKEKAKEYFKKSGRPPGWFLQQLLKLYAPIVIPGISSNVLVIDADTIFLNPVEFLNDAGGGLFCVSSHPAKQRYLDHAARLVPGYERVYPEFYSVCHHMLFQRPIVRHLFKTVEKFHKTSFWKAFCICVDIEGKKGASEYEIYYNFALRNTDQVQLRGLHWENSGDLNAAESYRRQGYHFVSFHTYMRRQ